MKRRTTPIFWLVLFLAAPTIGAAQGWGDVLEERNDHFHWFVGTYLPASELGSFGRYGVEMQPWITFGLSAGTGSPDDRIRTRFEMALTPDVKMRRSFENCADCTPDSRRLSVAYWRFLVDLTLPSPIESRPYLTAGPFMRVQLSDAEPCPRSAGNDCALDAFARTRVDPGLMIGAGLEPEGRWIHAIQLSGRLIYYGRDELPEASAASWLRAVELSVSFPLDL